MKEYRLYTSGSIFNYNSDNINPLWISIGNTNWYFKQNDIRTLYNKIFYWIKNKSKTTRSYSIGDVLVFYRHPDLYICHDIDGYIMINYKEIKETVLAFLRKCVIGEGVISSVIN